MSNICQDPVTCPNGNCVGCKNGQVWCQDTRCSPYCQGCSIPKNHDINGGMIIVIIILCLTSMLFIVWFVYGPQLFEHHDDHIRANVIVPDEYIISRQQ